MVAAREWGDYVWHQDKSTGKHLQFECTSCIYAQILEKYGIRKLGTIFCHADDVNYGSIPGVTFTRNHTLCKDGRACDFLITKVAIVSASACATAEDECDKPLSGWRRWAAT